MIIKEDIIKAMIIENLHEKIYRYETIVSEQISENYFTQKKYIRNIEVYYLEKAEENHLLQILVTDFDFSDDDNAMGKFYRELSYLFDEIEITVDSKGCILKVDNIAFLKLRWIKIVAKLSELHQGKAVENYFNQITTLLDNEDSLIQFFMQYNMLGLLFNGLWNEFDEKVNRSAQEGYKETIISEKKGDRIIQNITLVDIENAKFDNFKGMFFYEKENLIESYIETQKDNQYLKYSLLWIG